MSKGINKVILVGNVGNDVEVRQLPNGGIAANFSLATGESWNDRNTGEKREKTEWHRIVLFGKIAEIASSYVSKGSKVYLEGKLQTNKWTDKNNVERYTTEIVCSTLQILSSGNDRPAPAGNHSQGHAFQGQQHPNGYQPNIRQQPQNHTDYDFDKFEGNPF